MEKIRVRFAPSPTGYLHIGSARTALFNWLFARHTGGEFILRIEDTDLVRSKQEFLNEILESLKWLGMSWDGDPYFQSKRLELHKEAAKKLLVSGKAYEAEGALHLRMPQKKLKINDIVHGDIEFDTSLIKDQVLIKSDGMPTYNFACVIDDSDMKITHIIRGDDHISNTPKQVVIYEALGLPLPKFCHIPLILGVDRSRLSKRHGATSIRDYRDEGFLPEAIVNYLCMLGWSGSMGQEIMKVDQVIGEFSLEKINKTASVFDIKKLRWVNSEYIKVKAISELTDIIIEALKKEKLLDQEEGKIIDKKRLSDIIELFRERISTSYDFLDLARCFFTDELEYDSDGVKKFFTPETKAILQKLVDKLSPMEKFDISGVENAVRGLADELGIKAARIIHPMRLAATGKTVGAGLFETVALLGKEKTVERLKIALSKFFAG
ncbi:MAG: glutamate--tRNA ligase [Candidatus Omnitrophica bacterium]|nr:glutamate--tRNA ligase [Candidatus Omnitrophota bacterium]